MSKRKKWDSLRKYDASARRLFRFVDKDTNWSAFNPSIAKSPSGQIAMAVRSSNYLLGPTQKYNALTTGSDVRNRLWFAEMDDELQITDMYELEVVGELGFKRGIEDARLFWRDDCWYITGVILEKEHTKFARLGLFRIDLEAKQAVFIEKYDSPKFKKVPEKNWGMASTEETDEFDFIYGPNSIYKDGEVIQLAPPGDYKKLRGGTQLIPWEDGYLAVGHIMRMLLSGRSHFNPTTFSYQQWELRHYVHVFVKYDKQGRIEKISDEFVFNVEGVEFAAGIIEHQGKLYVSYGYDDCEGWLVSIDVETVQEMLHKNK